MPKKFGLNEKQRSKNYFVRKVEAQERKETKKQDAVQKQRQAQEDAMWQDDDKNLARKQERKQQEEQKRQEALKNKMEKQALLEEEEKQLAQQAKKKPLTGKKAKQYDAMQAQKMALMKSLAKQAATSQPQPEGGVIEEVKESGDNLVVEEQNQIVSEMQEMNLQEDVGEGDQDQIDKHPEKRMKNAYLKFEEERMPEMRKEFPTLKLTQLKEKLWKEWKKHPDNPVRNLK